MPWGLHSQVEVQDQVNGDLFRSWAFRAETLKLTERSCRSRKSAVPLPSIAHRAGRFSQLCGLGVLAQVSKIVSTQQLSGNSNTGTGREDVPRTRRSESETLLLRGTDRDAPEGLLPQSPNVDSHAASPHTSPESQAEHGGWARDKGQTTSAKKGQGSPNSSNKNTRAHLLVASENIRGRSYATIGGNLKWKSIADDIRSQKIGVMALQETHLTQKHVDDLNKLHKHIRIWNSASADNPTGAGGVALVFNKLTTNSESVTTHELVPGRALLATWEWHRGDKMTVLAIYAPTKREENRDFWEKVKKQVQETRGKFPKPDIVLGDFNMVEDEIDRFPAKLNPIDGPDSFTELKRYLRVSDGWRETFPDTTEWTWRNRARSTMSRIDRIYMTNAMLMASREWNIELSGLNANDHSRISVTVVNLDAPEIGRGRWTMTQESSQDKILLYEANKEVKKTWQDMLAVRQTGRTETNNPQRLWHDLKLKITKIAKRRTRELNCVRKQKEKDLVSRRDDAKAALEEATESPQRVAAKETLRRTENDLHALKEKQHQSTFEKRDARVWADAEKMTKSWFRWIKENKPRDTLTALQRPGSDPKVYVHDSKTMAEIAGNYHDKVQNKDLNVDEEVRKATVLNVLEHVTSHMREDDRRRAEAQITREDILESLSSAKNGSAAGLDGLIYEFWKALNRRYASAQNSEGEWADIAGVMTEGRGEPVL
ncbi:DNase I-like protein [Auricularia subglabra TFB-10046 SS5]|nr:DNase I-like protein [Auricularia subglabra TFB-10046 SS5]